MWHLFYGPNDIARDEEITRMKTKLGDPQIASLNTTVMDANASVKDIASACDTVSFLAEKRMVIVRNWITRIGLPKRKQSKETEDQVARLIGYLPELPETTALVLVEDGEISDAHPLIKLAASQDKSANGRVKHFELPGAPVQWISERVRQKGGEIDPAAAQLLASKINRGDKYDRDHFGEDSRLYLRKLDNEMEKLVAYATGRRIGVTDVELLVADEEVSEMFKFIDAVSVRDGDAAYKLMYGILARGESPLVVMTMLARQTRLMICAKEHGDLSSDQLATAINAHPYVAKKVAQQSQRFSMSELENAHSAIMEADLAVKTGRMDDTTALDMLVAMFCAKIET
jgi:DNA polymerase III subunit delta